MKDEAKLKNQRFDVIRHPSSFALIFIIFLLSGCAGLNYRTAPVIFDDPYARLGVVSTEPNAAEQAGVLLRLKPPPANVLNSREESKTYARIKNEQGLEIPLVQTRTDLYRSGSREDSSMVRSTVSFEGQPGSITEEIEVTDRGEILRLIEGKHDSKAGKFRIISWIRTSVLPEKPVKVGNRWTYDESMAMKIDSFWIKQKSDAPYTVHASSELSGFALLHGRRCAVISTKAEQTKDERFSLLFKGFSMKVRAVIRETTYLDHEKGLILGRFTTIKTDMTSEDSGLTETSVSQSIYFPV